MFDKNIIKSLLQNTNSWPFLEAKKLLNSINNKTPTKGYVLFETGYGPSGLPHIGTFAEVARTAMVRHAFSQISDIPTRLFCFSDDMDGLRKIPSNVPNQAMLAQHINKPLTFIPDPFEEEESYGHYMNKKLRSFLDRFEFEYEFFSSTKCYKSGMFDQMMLKVLNKYQDIMNLMLPTFRSERRETYSPFMPLCKDTSVVLQVPIEKIDKEHSLIFYRDSNNALVSTKVTGGDCKLQWKPDFGMRWAAFDVDYEMYGKDHMPNAKLYSEICSILGGKPPLQFFYELFLNEEGNKISKSKGNSITIDQWLQYAPLESLALFIYNSPSKAKRLYFDIIPKTVDEYAVFNKKYYAQDDSSNKALIIKDATERPNNDHSIAKKLDNPLYHIHKGDVPKIESYGINYALLLNLAAVCNPENKSVLWGFISKYNKNATPESSPYLDKLADFAVSYYKDFVKNSKVYLKPNEKHNQILKKIVDELEKIQVNKAKGIELDSEYIQEKLYAIGMEFEYANLRDYFSELYQILLGQKEGPRLGSFVKLFGVKETINLIKDVI